jgi:hypothetical protein
MTKISIRGSAFGVTYLLFLLFLIVVIEIATRSLISVDWLSQNFFGRSETMWRLLWEQSAKEQRIDGEASLNQHDNYLGWRLKPNLDLTLWDNKRFQTNADSIRGSRDYSTEAAPGITRIAMIGDSFTMGEEVGETETFSYQLQQVLPQTEVINFGVGGYGIDQILLHMEQHVVRYKPDVVVLGFVRDDMRRSMWSFRHHSKPILDMDNNLAIKNLPVPDSGTVSSQQRYRSRAWDILNVIWGEIRWRQGWFETDMVELGEAIMNRMLASIEAIGAEAVLVYLPHSEDLDMTYERFHSAEEQFFERVCADKQLRCLNLRGKFQLETSLGYPVKVGGHWLYNGHALVAKYIKSYFETEGLVTVE